VGHLWWEERGTADPGEGRVEGHFAYSLRQGVTPMPITLNATGKILKLFAMRTEPSLEPAAVGAKLTVMVHVAFTAIGDADTHVSVAE
jgi:hypothetical protein